MTKRLLHPWTGGGERGFLYWCPGCGAPHSLRTQGATPAQAVWGFDGNEAAPTFTPSVLSNAGQAHPSLPVCHCYIRAGKIQFLSDCTHPLAGKTVPMEEGPDWFRKE